MSRCVILSACPVQPELKRLLRSDDLSLPAMRATATVCGWAVNRISL